MQKKGFTLVELMVVISIIALLTSIVLSALNDARVRARDTARIRDMAETRKAIQMYFSDKGKYPYMDTSTNSGKNTVWSDLLISGGYIKKVNPEIRYGSLYNNGNNWCISPTHNCTWYKMGILLERKNIVLNSDSDANSSNSLGVDGLSTLYMCDPDATPTLLNDLDLCYDFSEKLD